jgi:hypothetical protein
MTATGTASINLASGSVIAVGNLTFNTAGGFVSGGTVASGNTLSFAGAGPTSLLQSGGLIGPRMRCCSPRSAQQRRLAVSSRLPILR